MLSEGFGSAPKRVVITIDELGNTASTTHFVALSKYLKEGRFAPEDGSCCSRMPLVWRWAS